MHKASAQSLSHKKVGALGTVVGDSYKWLRREDWSYSLQLYFAESTTMLTQQIFRRSERFLKSNTSDKFGHQAEWVLIDQTGTPLGLAQVEVFEGGFSSVILGISIEKPGNLHLISMVSLLVSAVFISYQVDLVECVGMDRNLVAQLHDLSWGEAHRVWVPHNWRQFVYGVSRIAGDDLEIRRISRTSWIESEEWKKNQLLLAGLVARTKARESRDKKSEIRPRRSLLARIFSPKI